MSEKTPQSGGRRGIIVAAATALVAVLGASLIVAGVVTGSGGPPQPPPSAVGDATGPAADSAADDSRVPSPKPGKRERSRPRPRNPEQLSVSSRAKPVELVVPAMDLRTRELVPLGRQPSGEIEVPEQWDTVGWYEGGPAPGQFGPAVMGGHVDSESGPAVFFRLGELRPGDTVKVGRADGKTAVFTVYSVEQFPKDDFPTRKVYAPTSDRAELRLITCGGTFNQSTGHHRANIVAFARMTAVR